MSNYRIDRELPHGFVQVSVSAPKALFDSMNSSVAVNIFDWTDICKKAWKKLRFRTFPTPDETGYERVSFVASRFWIDRLNNLQKPIPIREVLNLAVRDLGTENISPRPGESGVVPPPAPTPRFSVTTTRFTIDASARTLNIPITTENLALNQIQVTKDTSTWFSIGTVTTSNIPLIISENTDTASRPGAITITALSRSVRVEIEQRGAEAPAPEFLWMIQQPPAESTRWERFDKAVQPDFASSGHWTGLAVRNVTDFDNVTVSSNQTWVTNIRITDPDTREQGYTFGSSFTNSEGLVAKFVRYGLTQSTSTTNDRIAILTVAQGDVSNSIHLIQRKRGASINNWITGGQTIRNRSFNNNILERAYTLSSGVVARQVQIASTSPQVSAQIINNPDPFAQTIMVRFTRSARITGNTGRINFTVNTSLTPVQGFRGFSSFQVTVRA